MSTITLFSKIVFLVTGTFHYGINYFFFMYNYLRGNYIWAVNSNSIGEAPFEAFTMTLLLPFFFYGAYLYSKDLLIHIRAYMKGIYTLN